MIFFDATADRYSFLSSEDAELIMPLIAIEQDGPVAGLSTPPPTPAPAEALAVAADLEAQGLLVAGLGGKRFKRWLYTQPLKELPRRIGPRSDLLAFRDVMRLLWCAIAAKAMLKALTLDAIIARVGQWKRCLLYTSAPIAQGTRARAGEAVSSVRGVTMPAGATAAGSGAGSASGSLLASPLAVAGSAAAAGDGDAMVSRGMPVTLADGSSLGKVKEVVANSRGEVEQIVVKQGNVTRSLPAGMFSASGNALVLAEPGGTAAAPEAAEPSE